PERTETSSGFFGDPKNPLLVSVRSGAKFSMPGMMDTVLNLGLNEETLRGLAGLTGDERFAQDAYRRFIQMFGKIVLDVEGGKFEQIIEARKRRAGATVDTDLTARDLVEIAREIGVHRGAGPALAGDRKSTRLNSS